MFEAFPFFVKVIVSNGQVVYSNQKISFLEQLTFSKEISSFLSKSIIYMYIYMYNHRTTYSGCSSGSSSGVPTGLVGGAPAWPARHAADWAGRGAAAATAVAAPVCCSMIIFIYNSIFLIFVRKVPKRIF